MRGNTVFVKFIKPKSLGVSAENKLPEDLSKEIYSLYNHKPCSNFQSQEFQNDLVILKSHYQNFFQKVKIEKNKLDIIFNRLNYQHLSSYRTHPTSGSQAKELLETIIVYGKNESVALKLKQLLDDFSLTQNICVPGVVTNLSVIVYRLEMGDGIACWLADLKELAFDQAIQSFFKAHPGRINAGFEMHFPTKIKTSKMFSDLGLPSLSRLKKVIDPSLQHKNLVTTPEEKWEIRDRFWLNYLSEDFIQHIRACFENALQFFWDDEFGAKDSLGNKLDGKEKIAQANEDRDNVIRIIEPFVNAGLLDSSHSVLTEDGNHINEEFKKNLNKYCQRLLEKDVVYSEQEEQKLIQSFRSYLLDENVKKLPEDSEVLVKTPLGLSFLISLMLDPTFPLESIQPENLEKLLCSTKKENDFTTNKRLFLSFEETTYDQIFDALTQQLLKNVDIPTWSRIIPQGGIFAGLSLLSLIYKQAVLREKILPTLFEKHLDKIQAHSDKFGKAVSTPITFASALSKKVTVLSYLSQKPDKECQDLLYQLFSKELAVAPYIQPEALLIEAPNPVLDYLLEQGEIELLQDYFASCMEALVDYLVPPGIEPMDCEVNLARMMASEEGKKQITILFDILNLKHDIVYSEQFFHAGMEQIIVDPGKSEYNLMSFLCKKDPDLFFDFLEKNIDLDRAVNNMAFYFSLFVENIFPDGSIVLIDELLKSFKGRDILVTIASHKDFIFSDGAKEEDAIKQFQQLRVMGSAGFQEWLDTLNTTLESEKDQNKTVTDALKNNVNWPSRVFWLAKQFGANVNQQDGGGSTALYWACFKKDSQAVTALLTCKGIDVNLADNRGWTPLHEACRIGYQQTIEALLAHPDIEIYSSVGGMTPLYLALNNKCVDVGRVLLSRGDHHEISGANKDVVSQLFTLLQASPEYLGKTILFKDVNGAQYHHKLTQLRQEQFKQAWKEGNLDLLQILASLPDIDVNQYNEEGNPFFVWACKKSYEALAIQLLEREDLNLSLTNSFGNTGFYFACFRGLTNIVEQLLKKNSGVNAVNSRGYTPIMAACYKGHVDVVSMLLNENNITLNQKDILGADALDLACDQNEKEIVQLLIARNDVNVYRPINKGSPFLHWFYAKESEERLYEFLQREDLDVNCEDTVGRTLLHKACAEGNVELVNVLLKHKNINIDIVYGYTGETALHIACMNEHIAIVQALLAAVANVNQEDINGQRPLHIACQRGNKEIVQLLLEQDNIEPLVKNKRRQIAFDIACRRGEAHIAALFWEKNIGVGWVNDNDETVLHVACLYGYKEIVDNLFEQRDISINATDNSGRTALHHACHYGDITIVEKLLTAENIDINCVNDAVPPPFYSAFAQDHFAIVERLLACETLDIVACLNVLLTHNKMDVNDEQQHANIVQYLIEYVLFIQYAHHLLATLDAIGVGKGNQKGDDDILSVLRYRNLRTVKAFKNMGYRETNDTEKLAQAIFARAYVLLNKMGYKIDSQEIYEQFAGIYNRQITRHPKKKEVEVRLANFEEKVTKLFEDEQPVNRL